MKNIGEFDLHEEISQGSMTCRVFRGVQRNTQNEFAVKAIPKNFQSSLRYIQNELQALRTVKHPNIVKLFRVLESETSVYIVMEFCPLGDINSYIERNGPFEESTAKVLIKQLVSALIELQMHSKIRPDIKSCNVFVTGTPSEPVAKIGDVFSRTEDSRTLLGSQLFLSPEIFDCTSDDFKSDVWSFGVVAYHMLVGKLPYIANSTAKLIQKQTKNISFPPRVSLTARSFLEKALTYSAADRASFAELKEHPFLAESIASNPSPCVSPIDQVAEWLKMDTLRLDAYHVELKQAYNQIDFYLGKNKSAGLGLLHAILWSLRDLFSEVQTLRSQVTQIQLDSDRKFCELYEDLQDYILSVQQKYKIQMEALRLTQEVPRHGILEAELYTSLLKQLRKQTKKTGQNIDKIRSVLQILLILNSLWPENTEVQPLIDTLAERASSAF